MSYDDSVLDYSFLCKSPEPRDGNTPDEQLSDFSYEESLPVSTAADSGSTTPVVSTVIETRVQTQPMVNSVQGVSGRLSVSTSSQLNALSQSKDSRSMPRNKDPEPRGTDYGSGPNVSASKKSLADGEYGKQLRSLWRRTKFSNQELKEMYKRRMVPTLDIVGLINFTNSIEENTDLKEAMDRVIPVALKVELMSDELERTRTILRSLQHKVADDARGHVRAYSAKFGSMAFPPPPGTWTLSASTFRPGCDLGVVYDALRNSMPFKKMERNFDSRKFMRHFLCDVVDKAYSKEHWPYVTARIKEQSNGMIAIDHRTVIAFITATCKHGGSPLYAEGDLAAKRSEEGSILRNMQFTLENKRRTLKKQQYHESASDGSKTVRSG